MIPGDKSYYPGTDVLINKYGIRDGKTLEALEYKFVAARELELRERPLAGNFDLPHLKAIHRHLFGDVYDWAGKLRDLDFAKRNMNTGMVNRFMPTARIEDKAAEIAKYLEGKKQLKGMPKVEFLKEFAQVHTMLNEMHPFREGNGRSTRVFLTQLAKEAGFKLDLTKIDKDRWNHASHKAQTQYDPKDESVRIPGSQMDIRQIFHETLTPTKLHAFEVEKPEVAMRLYPELKADYDRITALQAYAAKMPDPRAAQALVDAARARIRGQLLEEQIITDQGLLKQLEPAATAHAFVAQREAIDRGAGPAAAAMRQHIGQQVYADAMVTEEESAPQMR